VSSFLWIIKTTSREDIVNHYFIIYKPYGYLSQFTKEVPEHRTLADLGGFPKDVYPVGRLDKDSEGLLLITNDKKLNHRLLNPKFQHQRTYWVQVEGIPTQEAIQKLNRGVDIKVTGKTYHTLPAKARLLPHPGVPDRDPPVRFRKNVPTSWLEIELHEGKNRQVRKMCAAVGFPVLRLIRTKIERLGLRDMQIGDVREVKGDFLYKLLKINA